MSLFVVILWIAVAFADDEPVDPWFISEYGVPRGRLECNIYLTEARVDWAEAIIFDTDVVMRIQEIDVDFKTPIRWNEKYFNPTTCASFSTNDALNDFSAAPLPLALKFGTSHIANDFNWRAPATEETGAVTIWQLGYEIWEHDDSTPVCALNEYEFASSDYYFHAILNFAPQIIDGERRALIDSATQSSTLEDDFTPGVHVKLEASCDALGSRANLWRMRGAIQTSAAAYYDAWQAQGYAAQLAGATPSIDELSPIYAADVSLAIDAPLVLTQWFTTNASAPHRSMTRGYLAPRAVVAVNVTRLTFELIHANVHDWTTATAASPNVTIHRLIETTTYLGAASLYESARVVLAEWKAGARVPFYDSHDAALSLVPSSRVARAPSLRVVWLGANEYELVLDVALVPVNPAAHDAADDAPPPLAPLPCAAARLCEPGGTCVDNVCQCAAPAYRTSAVDGGCERNSSHGSPAATTTTSPTTTTKAADDTDEPYHPILAIVVLSGALLLLLLVLVFAAICGLRRRHRSSTAAASTRRSSSNIQRRSRSSTSHSMQRRSRSNTPHSYRSGRARSSAVFALGI